MDANASYHRSPFPLERSTVTNLLAFDQLKVVLSCDSECVASRAVAKLRSRQKQ